MPAFPPRGESGHSFLQDGDACLRPSTQEGVPPGSNSSTTQDHGSDSTTQPRLGYSDQWPGSQSQFQDMHTFHPSYMFNAHEVTNEYNLLNDFLSTSLQDDGMYSNDEFPASYNDPSLINSMASSLGGSNGHLPLNYQQNQPPLTVQNTPQQAAAIRQTSSIPLEKAKETYYMTAADPSGTDPPEERMDKLLKAKYDAGLLKPFNYVKGYARLQQYMDQHMQPSSKQKILRQLDRFRPKFRERMHSLTDIELVLVEMWFERSLMEYDRVFASMAIPACCWRRTGEIFRGNKEMAELIHVPIESFRDGKLAIHEIIIEDQLVSYWEKFGAIAFDSLQKAMLTSCTLKNPDAKAKDQEIKCCFSFTIRRDNHNIGQLLASGASKMMDSNFASHLQKSLECESEASSALPDPSAYLQAFPLSQVTASPTRSAVDRAGTQLWNLCRKFDWNRTESGPTRHASIRALAFFMIESAQERNHKAPTSERYANLTLTQADLGKEGLRLVSLGLAAAKCCLYSKQHGLASQILERVAYYLEGSSRCNSPKHLFVDHSHSQRYLEYIRLRMALSWQQDRLDLTEHLFTTVDLGQLRSTPTVTEDMVDMLFHIGRDLLSRGSHDMAVVWLKRASRLLEHQDIECLSSDAGELRLNLLHTSVRALHCLECSEARQEAGDIMQILLRDYGNKLAVRLLQLDIISRTESPDRNAYHAALNAISMMMHLTKQNFSINELACRVLKRFLLQRLASHGNEEWITKAFITLIWMSTTGESTDLQLSELGTLFNDLFSSWKSCLCPEATHGALVLLWKRIEDTFDHGQFQDTIKWCELALHKLLEKAGDINVDKIARRMVQCYLEISELGACKALVTRLLESKMSNPLNHYLAYCLALRTEDINSAQAAVTALNDSPTMNENLLYACISKTLESGTSEQAANILLSLLDKYNFDPPEHIILPALLRCTVRLYLSQLTHEADLDRFLVDTVLRLFTAVPEALERRASTARNEPRQAPDSESVCQNEFSATEIMWFLVNCYNLAVKVASTWPASAVISLFDIVIRITAHRICASTDLEGDAFMENNARKCLCHFAITVVCTAEARQHSDLDSKAKYYYKTLTAATEFAKTYKVLQQHTTDVQAGREGTKHYGNTMLELDSKRQVLLPLEFEAATHQHLNMPESAITTTPNDLSAIISNAQHISAPRKIYALFADIVLSSTYRNGPQHDKDETTKTLSSSPVLPLPTASALLIHIIQAVRTLPDYDAIRASRWIRCLVQLCLDQHRGHHGQKDTNKDDSAEHHAAKGPPKSPLTTVEDIIAQAVQLARQSLLNRTTVVDPDSGKRNAGDGKDCVYPAEELEWLSATLFNLGIDFYVSTTAYPNDNKTSKSTANMDKKNDEAETDAEAQARKWIGIAVEIADVLAEYEREEGGDKGLLGRVLRGKVKEGLGWVV
ncbi:hypothetical protein EPUS_03359 [Endocarpon pusillum Z07020]|uniref:ERT1/acuK family PAS domain-containing protein n=1 Tax=Endocarpon pusillum (strain Z07020 / HMAS-L-300199) TaxID=1263415 RepID=U1HXL2_ENDPU|nr:uncharacterized protein EPUS_03359 [Endocarpon pusillum Z07020]ERF74169.1 hypothetical protein EPUS_03359 [Endocarpon pusillum Z07020]